MSTFARFGRHRFGDDRDTPDPRIDDGPVDGPVDDRRQVEAARQKRVRDDVKLLAKAKESLVESERRVSRQSALLAELRAGGGATAEVEKSLARLEAAVLEQRASCDLLVSKAQV